MVSLIHQYIFHRQTFCATGNDFSSTPCTDLTYGVGSQASEELTGTDEQPSDDAVQRVNARRHGSRQPRRRSG